MYCKSQTEVKEGLVALEQNNSMKKSVITLIIALSSFVGFSQNHPFYSSDDPLIKKALSRVDPIEYQNYFFKGLRYKILGDDQTALEAFKNCIRLDGSEAAPMYESAMIYFQNDELDEALFFIESACQIDPDNKWYQQLLATTYLQTGHYPKAISVFKTLLELEPANEDWHFELASAYLLNNQAKNAIKVYDDLEKYIGPYSMLFQQKKRIYNEIGEKANAIKEIEKWVEAEPQNPEALNELAQLYLLAGKQDKTIVTLERLLDIQSDNASAFIMLSDLYRNNKDPQKAFEYTKKAFSSKDLAIDSKMRLLLTYYDWSDQDSSLLSQAYQLIDVLKECHPNDAKPYTIAGDYYYRDGKLDQAQHHFESAAQLDPSRYPIWQQLMIIAFDLKDYQKVTQYALSTQELFPSQPTSYYFGGLAFLQQKKYSSAIDQLSSGKLMVMANDNLLAQFYASLGDAYHAIEDYKQSDQSYDQSLSLLANNTYVLNNYSYYLSLRGQKLDKALEMMEKCVELEPNQSSYEDTYAWVYYKKKDYQKALFWLEKALKNGGASSATIVEHYGDILFRLSKVEEALEQWQKARELGSESPWIDQKIAHKKLYE